MSLDLAGPLTAPAPPREPFARLTPAERAALPTDAVDAHPLTEAQAAALARVLTAAGARTGNRLAVRRHRPARPFDERELRRALAALTAAHETLRSSFAVDGPGRPLQVVHAAAEVPLVLHDLRGLDEPRRAAARAAHEAVERDVPLSAAPPLRLTAQWEDDATLRLVLVHSPALLDAHGAGRLLTELGRVLDGAAPAPAEPSAAHAAAEAAALADRAGRDHWRRITDACAPLLLPDGWGDPDRAGRQRLTVPFDDLTQGLRTLADRAGAPLGTVLLAAHLRVLGSLTPDAAFHTAVLADAGPAAAPALGAHRNAVAFPHGRAARSWRQLVADVRRRQRAAEPYRHHPFEAVRRAARTAGRFADVLFDPAPAAGPDGDGAPFPLVVEVHGDALVLRARYDRLDEAHGALLAGLYREVLAAMAQDPDGDAARHRLPGDLAERLLAAGRPAGPGRTAPLLPELVAARAAATPRAPAVVTATGTVDYRTLDAQADRIARRLRERGAGPGDLVGILLRRTPLLPAALLGVLRAGAAYVPLDPSVPAARLAHILQATDAPLVLTETALADRIPAAFAERAVALDTAAETAALARQPAGPPAAAPGPRDPAYVIFTSGSTGTPKGVMVGHGALAGLLHSFADLGGDWLAATSVSFDISALELYLPLVTGGRLVLADDTEAKDPAALLRLVDAHGVTHVQATPSGWRLLLAVGFDRPQITALAGGEELPVALAAALRARVGTLTNVYGPTETAIWSGSWQVPPDPAEVVLGAPLPGERLLVLDRALEPVPPGVAGELCIGGSGVALGYHGRPALTADRFVPDPYGAPGDRLYRTGDLARRRADGALEFLGRIDTQVKIGGHRIELGEIRAALTSHPAVRDAVAAVREPSPGDKRIVAYVVAAGRTDVADLRRHLAAALPGYMMPAAFVGIPRIPLGTSGKVDLGALPAPGADTAARQPAGPVERRLAALCAEHLGLRGLGPDDDFLERGAPPLSVVRLLQRIRRDHGVDRPLSALFARPTIGGLAAAIAAAAPATARPDTGGGTAPTDSDTPAREYKA